MFNKTQQESDKNRHNFQIRQITLLLIPLSIGISLLFSNQIDFTISVLIVLLPVIALELMAHQFRLWKKKRG